MARPRRAAAVRAASGFAASAQSPSDSPEGTPVRSLRRATFRSSRHGARDLKRRRADFERVVKFHQINLHDLKQRDSLDQSLTDESVQLSQDDVSITSQWAQHILEQPLDQLRTSLRQLLLRLQSTCNLTEAAEEGDKAERVGTPPSDHEDVSGLSNVLLTERFMSHEGEHVKLLVACCLAELLRICAPDSPVPERKLNQVCALFVEQLAVLSAKNDPAEPYRFSLLEQLATVKTFVIFADDDEVICDIFACFYAVVKPHHSDKVKLYFADILTSLLEETENLSTAVLDALLAPFVSAYGYSQDATALAARVLHGASSFIQVSLSSLLNASIRDLRQESSSSSPRKGGHGRKSPTKFKLSNTSGSNMKEHSEHHEYIQDLIVAINQVTPDVLVYVIPNLEDGLMAKDVQRRLASSTLLGRLFMSRADVANAYPSLFAEFLNRGRDENADIRTSVTSYLGRLMKIHPKHRHHIDDLLRNRVLDRSEAVRVSAIQSITKAGDSASGELLKLHATRLRDKKPSVRYVTADAVNELFTPSWQSEQIGFIQLDIAESMMRSNGASDSQNLDLKKDGDVDFKQDESRCEYLESRMVRLSWLPDTLVESMLAVDGIEDHATARRIERIIISDIPALTTKKTVRKKRGLRQLCVFLSQLSDAAYLTLSARLRDKWRARSKLKAIAHQRLQARKTSEPAEKLPDGQKNTPASSTNRKELEYALEGPQTDRSPEEVNRLAESLAASFRRRYSISGDVVAMCKLLSEIPDLRCIESIEKSIDCCATFEEHTKQRITALQRANLSSAAQSFFSDVLLPDCFPGVLSAQYFSLATEIAVEESRDRDEEIEPEMEEHSQRILRGILRFLGLFEAQAKEVLVHVIDDVQSLCTVEVDGSIARAEVLLCGLRLANQVPAHLLQQLGEGTFLKKLRTLMISPKLVSVERGAALAKAAAQAAIKMFSESSDPATLSELVGSLVFELDSFSGHPETIVAPLTALSQVAKHSQQSFKAFSLGCFDFSRGLLSGSLNAKIKAASKEGESSESNSMESTTQETLTPIFGAHTEPLSRAITVPEHLLRATLVQQAIKLFVYSFTYLEDEELSSVVKVLLNVAFEKQGIVFENTEETSDNERSSLDALTTASSEAMSAANRLFCGRGIIYLARHPKHFRGMSPSVLCSTVLLLQDENACVRICFATKICDSIMRKRLPLRWVVGLALMAVDPDRKNVGHVKSLLSSVFRHRRRVYEQAKRGAEKNSMLLLPEVTVPELIWILGNLPDVELDESSGFQESEKCIQLFLDRLLESNEHAGVLHEYIESLSIAQDVTEDEESGAGPRTQRMTELGQIAAAILKKKQAGKKWNLTGHPGEVSLPKDMFRLINRKTETSGVRPVSLVQVARRFDEGGHGGSGKKKPGETIRGARASPVVRGAKSSSASKSYASNGTPGSTSRARSEKRPSPVSESQSPLSRKVESPPKRSRISRSWKRLSDELPREDSHLCDSPLAGSKGKMGNPETQETENMATDDTNENVKGVEEESSKPATRARTGRKRGTEKGPKTLRKATACASEVETKITRIRRSARNRRL